MAQRRTNEELLRIARERVKDLEARTRKEARKRDTRRKIIAGAFLLNAWESMDRRETTLDDLLTAFRESVADRDRHLFQDDVFLLL